MRTRAAAAVLAALTVLPGCGRDVGEKPSFEREDHAPVHGWVFFDGDRDYISEMLALAPTYGVTQVQLSGRIYYIEDITERPETTELVRSVAREAETHGVDVLVWAHEFSEDLDAVCFDPRAPIWEERREQYRRAFELVPELDGIVLMFGSSALEPWFAECGCADAGMHRATCSDATAWGPDPAFMLPPPGERVRQIIETVADVTEALGKQLLVRTFIHSPWELEWVGEGLRLASHRTFTVMSKPVPQDFQPHYPHNRLIGTVPTRPQITEFDLAGEYWGQGIVLNPQVEYLTYRFRYLWDRQGIGIVSRIDRYENHVVGTPSEINVFATSALMEDPGIHPDAIYAAWFERRYGLAPGTAESEAFKRVHQLSWEATRKRHYVLGFWALTKHSYLPDDLETRNLDFRSSTKYGPGLEDVYWDLGAPSESTLRRIFQENREAVLAAREAEEVFEEIRPALSEGDASEWARRLRQQTLECEAWQWAEEVLWGIKLFRRSRDPRHRGWLEHGVRQLAAVGDRLHTEIGPNPLETEIQISDMVTAFRAEYGMGKVRPIERATFTIGLPTVEGLSATGARIRVEVDQPARCALHWGTAIPYTPAIVRGSTESAMEHTFELTGLSGDTFYLFRPVCRVGDEELKGGDWYLWTPPRAGAG